MSATKTTIIVGIAFVILIALISYSLYLTKGQPANEIRKTACATADQAGTCTTRLNDLGITPEQCCRELGKCCTAEATAQG